jgi:hypothetical protein
MWVQRVEWPEMRALKRPLQAEAPLHLMRKLNF